MRIQQLRSKAKVSVIFNMRGLYYLNFPTGGITRYANEVLREMPSDFEGHVVCPPGSIIDAPRLIVHSDLMDLRRNFVFGRRLRFLWSQFQNPIRLIRNASNLRPDLIHFGNINYFSYFYWRSRLKSSAVPFVVTVHDVRRHQALLHRNWEDSQLIAVYQDAAVLFVHSLAQKADLIAFANINPAKVIIVPHGIYGYPIAPQPLDIRKELGIPQNADAGLFFGGIRDDKGLDKLIAAVSGLADTHLIVAGRSMSKAQKPISYYRDLALKLHVKHRIHFIEDFIPEERVADYFHAADWCGLVYDKAFTSQSGVLCSAVHFRTPVLVASSPTLVETAKTYRIGVVATDASVDALVDAIRQLKIHRDEDYDYKEFETECAWQRNAHITYTTYHDILNSKAT